MDSTFYAFVLSFSAEHWFLTWCALWLLWPIWSTVHALIFRLPVRTIRAVTVLLRGWPPAHLDADGDWRPAQKVEEKTETATIGDLSHTVKSTRGFDPGRGYEPGSYQTDPVRHAQHYGHADSAARTGPAN